MVVARSVLAIAVIGAGLQLGVSYAHFMQRNGKLQLPLEALIKVQNEVIVYQSKLGPIEVVTLFAALAAAILFWRANGPRLPIVVGTLALAAMFAVWAVWIRPINMAIDGWTPTSAPADWRSYAVRWHDLHLVRLGLASLATIALAGSLALAPAPGRR